MPKKKIQEFLNKYMRQFIATVFGGVIFLSFAHHFINFWEQPALMMLGLFVLFVPIIAWATFALLKRAAPHLKQIPGKRILLLSFAAILMGLFIAWRGYRAPADYQTITITPVLSQNQTLGLLELKAEGMGVSIKPVALENNWQEINGILYATSASGPITISFKRAANAPVSLLLIKSPQGGMVSVSFENENIRSDLYSATPGQLALHFTTRYRGIPNWIFIPALILVDVLAFGLLILAGLLLQDIGQGSASSTANPHERFPGYRTGMAILLGVGILFHLLNALSVPLILDADSLAYLIGATHWLKFGNLDGVPIFRGPGTTFLFAPVMLIFGRNPWGIKIFLHLLAIACIPLSYHLGWQLSHKRIVALAGGILAVLIPEMYLYSNFVMSDMPNLFFVLVFCTLLISTLEIPNFRTMLAALLVGSFASLLRSENVLLLILAFFVLAIPPMYAWSRDIISKNRTGNNPKEHLRKLSTIGFAFAIALLPLFWWAAHNYKLFGFASLGNHSGVVLYDGWVYYGDASKLSFSDPDSPAIQEIRAAVAKYPFAISDITQAPTSGEVYPSLVEAGYSDYEAFQLLGEAARDSIRHDWNLTLKLLFIKIKTGLTPKITHSLTYSLPGKPAWTTDLKERFFDAENLSIPPLITMQRTLNQQTKIWYPKAYPVWVLFCILTMALSLFRSPAKTWIVFVLIVATRIFVATIMGPAGWRYTLAGWIPLQIIAISWIALLIDAVRAIFPAPAEP